MKVLYFDRLSLPEKAWLIQHHGTLLMGVTMESERYLLYGLGGAFVEISFTYDNIVSAIYPLSYKNLEKYLSFIDCSDAFN